MIAWVSHCAAPTRLRAKKNRNGKPYMKDVPHDAHVTYAEGEFNRHYIRAICIRSIEVGHAIEVIRAKEVLNARSASVALVGQRLAAAPLLEALQTDYRVDNAFGSPPGPNSGLAIRILHGIAA